MFGLSIISAAFFVCVSAQQGAYPAQQQTCETITCRQGEVCDMYRPCPDENCGFVPICLPTRHSCLSQPCNRGERCLLRHGSPPTPRCIPDRSHIDNPGQCPKPNGYGPCSLPCKHDGDCPANRDKCCFNGCGTSCEATGHGGYPQPAYPAPAYPAPAPAYPAPAYPAPAPAYPAPAYPAPAYPAPAYKK